MIPVRSLTPASPEARRDRAAYALAEEYLLSFAPLGITEDLLRLYLEPDRKSMRLDTVEEVYRHIVFTAQNRGMSVRVIGSALGGIDNLRAVLCDFSPAAVLAKYGTRWSAVLDDIESELRPKGKIRKTSRGLWPLFCRTITSGAAFMTGFSSAEEFHGWVDIFDRDERARPALPMLLSLEIEGFGFPLACDFLKELGYFNFGKPDVHLKAIFKGLGFVNKPGDYEVFKAISRVARHRGVTPYNVDKLFWLVGSGYFYDHPQLGSRGRIGTDRARFIREAQAKLCGRR